MIILKLASHLFESEQQVFPLKELSDLLKIDRRTIIRLIYEYEHSKINSPGFKMTIEGDSLYTAFNESFSLKSFYQLIFRNTVLFDLCYSLFNQSFTNLVDFANTHFMSLSSIYRRITKLKATLTEYHIFIEFTDNHYFMGEEKQIRHFFYDLFSIGFGLEETFFKLESTFTTFLDTQIDLHLKTIPFPIKQKIKLVTIITLTRIEGQFYLPKADLGFTYYDVQIPSSDLELYIKSLLAPFLPQVIDEEAEIQFFILYILTIDIIAIDYFNYIDIQSINFNHPHFKMAENWITELTFFFKIKLSPAEYFFLLINLYYHYVRNDLLECSSRYNLNPYLEKYQLKNDNPYALKKASLFITYLKTKPKFLQSPGLNHLYYLLIRDILFLSSIRVHVCIFSSLAHSQKISIEKKLKQLTVVPILFDEVFSEETDLLITDFYYPQIEPNPQNLISAVVTETFPTKRNYDLIIEKIMIIFDYKN